MRRNYGAYGESFNGSECESHNGAYGEYNGGSECEPHNGANGVADRGSVRGVRELRGDGGEVRRGGVQDGLRGLGVRWLHVHRGDGGQWGVQYKDGVVYGLNGDD